jgi:hypothetical protein
VDWALLVSVLTLLVFGIGAGIAIYELIIIRRRHQFDTAPFVTAEIEETTSRKPPANEVDASGIIVVDEIDKWAQANPQSGHRYLSICLQNRQKYHTGVAVEVNFRVTLRFPEYKTPNTMMEIPHHVKGKIWLDSGEVFRLLFTDLKGLPTGIIDIDKIEYYDIDGNKYKRAYGHCRWELDNTGQESWDFKSFK